MPITKTPGVYIAEPPVGPPAAVAVQVPNAPAIIGVQTSIPVFIGYTERTKDPLLLSSLAEYQTYFGGGFTPTFQIEAATASDYDFEASGGFFKLTRQENGTFHLYNALRLFFANGGSNCYVVSCGAYGPILLEDLQKGLAVSANQVGPSMVVIPDACLLDPADYSALTVATLQSCASLQDRVAILDLQGCTDPAGWSNALIESQANAFYSAVAGAAASYSYGAAYYPALKSSIVAPSEVTSANLDLEHSVAVSMTGELMAQIQSIILSALNVAPPSGAIAGLWAQNDQINGVWKAPAGIGPVGVVAPAIQITDAEQAPLNTPSNGIAIDVIRTFPSQGPLVWGARTLDGNSSDYRYIPVRRTLIYVEQSIKTAMQQMVFAPNTAQTWATVTSSISNFLTSLWTQGGLLGDKACDAFHVECGVGSSMTAQDILNGYMIATVTLALVHPSEFIELSFTQEMQGA